MQLSKRDVIDLSRSAGGLLLSAGAVVVLVRKSGQHGWSDFARFLIVVVPAVILYAMALGRQGRSGDREPQPWQSVLMVTAILLGALALSIFIELINPSTNRPLYSAGIFVCIAVLAGYVTWRVRVRYTALLCGLSALVAWLIVWGSILGSPSPGTFRWLLVAAAALLLLAGARLAQRGSIGASEIATAGGLAAVLAGVLGVVVGAYTGIIGRVTPPFEESSTTSITRSRRFSNLPSTPIHRVPAGHQPSSAVRTFPKPISHHAPSNPFVTTTSGLQHFGWDAYLLVVSLLLIWIGSRNGTRGLGYVGGLGLLAFIISVIAQITRLETGHSPSTSIVGWPLALLLTGIAALAAPALYRRNPE